MARKKLFWQFYSSYMIITCFVLFLISSYAYKLFTKFYFDETAKDLETRTYLISDEIQTRYNQSSYDSIDQLCKNLGKKADVRITVITADGSVLGDTEHEPKSMVNHSDRPEVAIAQKGKIGKEKRYSTTLDKWMIYVAVPVVEDNQVVLVIRSSQPMTAIDTRLKEIFTQGAQYIIVLAVIAALISLFISRRINRPLEEIKKGAELFAKGDLNFSLEIPNTHELAALANSMNKMARELSDRITTITNQKNETQAILSSMVEGVIALDDNGKILSINNAACELLNIDSANAKGKNVEECIRYFDIQDFINQILESNNHHETEVSINDDKPQYFHIYGKTLAGVGGEKQIGAIIVLNDITLIRQLENVRSEFVANVSHELKTPITSIKGFVETLLDGAIEKPDEAKRFLHIIARQTNRLNAIIEDLLILSKVEDLTQRDLIEFEKTNLRKPIETAVEICQIKAKEKDITLIQDYNECVDCKVEINDFLIEQAIVNLLSNAIKYSESGKKVFVKIEDMDSSVDIHVKDQGYGIPKEHIERVFERFYVTDKARTRNLGGTGLGLAIVKHIAQAHNGSVYVESEIGQGSQFTIRIPKTQD